MFVQEQINIAFFAQSSIHVFSKLERICVVYETEENSEIFCWS